MMTHRANKGLSLALAIACLLVLWMAKRESEYSSQAAVADTRKQTSDDVQKKHANPGLHEKQAMGPDLALIIETQMTPNLVPVMLHFATVLGPKWPIVLFTLEEHWVMPPSAAFRRAVDTRSFDIRFLPPNTSLGDSQSVSRFLTKPWIWEQVQSARRTLLFQTDSIICSKAETVIEEFLQHDFVGAPIHQQYGPGYNGGLSIRNPKLFLNITRDVSFEASAHDFEDQWFYAEAKAREGNGVKLPQAAVAKLFAVETIYYEKPLGYHQPSRWQADHMEEIEEYCPEVKMLTSRRAT